MTTSARSILSVVASLSLAGAALAQAPAGKPAAAGAAATAVAPVPVRPSPQVDTFFKSWAGDWKCDTTIAAGALGAGKPEAKARASLKVEKEANGFWYRGEYAREGTKIAPPIQAVMVVGYDAGARAPFSFRYDSWGGLVVETAPGATPEKVVYTGDAHLTGMKARFRDTMTLKGTSEMEHTFDMDTGSGFKLMQTDVCKK